MNDLEESPSLIAKKNELLNEFERRLAECPAPPIQPVTHRFTPGLYSREIRMQAGLVCTSKIHKTHHQFVVSKGRFMMWSENAGWEEYSAPFHGETKPGARRAFHILEDTVFCLFYPTTLTDPAEIEREMIEFHPIPTQKCPSLE